ncbi:MAG: VWA domain-containing protein [Acidobacteria bacterium]|nr:VWA domain-containing protein [Acidobacteriota bacterium]
MSNIEFVRPALILLFLVPLGLTLLRRYFVKTADYSLADQLHSRAVQGPPLWLYLPRVIDWITVGLVVMALAGPALLMSRKRTLVKAVDLILCLDLSSSMNQTFGGEDSPSSNKLPSRMEAMKEMALDFVNGRPHDRIGLVVFSANGYVVNPLTTDHRVLVDYLSAIDTNILIGEGLTSVGEGLQASNDLIWFFHRRAGMESKAVIVLTDAEQNYGMTPEAPLSRAKTDGTRVYFIGVGAPIEQVLGSLKGLVSETGGGYYDATNPQQLREIALRIDKLEKNPLEITEYVRNRPFQAPFIQLALLMSASGTVLRFFRRFYVTA